MPTPTRPDPAIVAEHRLAAWQSFDALPPAEALTLLTAALLDYPGRNTHQLQARKICTGVALLARERALAKAAEVTVSSVDRDPDRYRRLAHRLYCEIACTGESGCFTALPDAVQLRWIDAVKSVFGHLA